MGRDGQNDDPSGWPQVWTRKSPPPPGWVKNSLFGTPLIVDTILLCTHVLHQKPRLVPPLSMTHFGDFRHLPVDDSVALSTLRGVQKCWKNESKRVFMVPLLACWWVHNDTHAGKFVDYFEVHYDNPAQGLMTAANVEGGGGLNRTPPFYF